MFIAPSTKFPAAFHAGLKLNLPSIVTSNPLSLITSLSYLSVLIALFIFLALEPTAGDKLRNANIVLESSAMNPRSFCLFHSIITFFIVDTTAPGIPNPPLRVVSIIEFKVYSHFLSFSACISSSVFSSSSSLNPGIRANKPA